MAGVGQGDHHIVAGDHAEVAVAGLGRMNEKGRCAGGSQCGRELARHMARLADAAHHDPALAVENQAAGRHKRLTDAIDERGYRISLDAQHLTGLIDHPGAGAGA